MPTDRVTLTTGLLGQWQRRNRANTIPHTVAKLREAGNLDNLRRLVEVTDEPYQGRYPFLDTDVYKTLEGLAYEIGRGQASDGVIRFFDEAVTLIERAQQKDGYLNSWFQHPQSPKKPWEDMAWGHELYNLGHLIQAAVAARRQARDARLLAVARRFADLAVERFGVGRQEEVCGHPEVEMALVELYRQTGDDRYLTLARLFIDRRGHGLLRGGNVSPEYFQDAVPLRELPSVTGHAVRMTYLAAGATDVYLETKDDSLLAALERLWDDMVAGKLYLTGGLGSRHSDEAIGDRYELPAERSYSETCAAIGAMQWGWRMFLATGDAHYIDVFETVLYNAFAVGLSADGTRFFYDNPLQRRPDHEQRSGAETGGERLRRPWFGCACCPPNVVRWMSQLQDYIAAETPDSLIVANYTAAELQASEIGLRMDTDYPWSGEVRLTVTAAPAQPYGVTLRIPGWAHTATVTVNGERVAAQPTDGWLRVERQWAVGDGIALDLAMPVRAHGSHPHLDATRGCLAVARGPLVYCAEQQDNEVDVDDLVVTVAGVRSAVTRVRRLTADAPDDSVILSVPAASAVAPSRVLYPELDPGPFRHTSPSSTTTTTTATLVPYFLWGNREASAMRVWIRTD